MNRKRREILTPILLLLCFSLSAWSLGKQDIVQNEGKKLKIYVIQLAASKTFIEPDYFQRKFNLKEEVRYFRKNGWYKYVHGSFETPDEAINALGKYQTGAFVTSIDPEVLLPPIHVMDSLKTRQLIPERNIAVEEAIRRLYDLRIRQADSAFYYAKNFLLARELYLEASLIQPEKHYPADQMAEVEKQMVTSGGNSLFSRIPFPVLVLATIAALLILFSLIMLVLRKG